MFAHSYTIILGKVYHKEKGSCNTESSLTHLSGFFLMSVLQGPFYSDRGIHFTCRKYSELTNDMKRSYSEKEVPYDNACIESFHSLIKKRMAESQGDTGLQSCV